MSGSIFGAPVEYARVEIRRGGHVEVYELIPEDGLPITGVVEVNTDVREVKTDEPWRVEEPGASTADITLHGRLKATPR